MRTASATSATDHSGTARGRSSGAATPLQFGASGVASSRRRSARAIRARSSASAASPAAPETRCLPRNPSARHKKASSSISGSRSGWRISSSRRSKNRSPASGSPASETTSGWRGQPLAPPQGVLSATSSRSAATSHAAPSARTSGTPSATAASRAWTSASSRRARIASASSGTDARSSSGARPRSPANAVTSGLSFARTCRAPSAGGPTSGALSGGSQPGGSRRGGSLWPTGRTRVRAASVSRPKGSSRLIGSPRSSRCQARDRDGPRRR